MRKWFLTLLAIGLVAAAAYGIRSSGIDLVKVTGLGMLFGSGAEQGQTATPAPRRDGRGPQPVEIAKAAAATLSNDVSAIGTLLAEESVALSSETSGRVAEILFADGTDVDAGAPLFRLDTDLASAGLSEAKARLALAEANYGRNQTLRKSGNVAQSAYDAALSEREVARAAVETAEVHLRKLTISAPFAGTLGFRTISLGAYVNAGTPLVDLTRINRLKVSFAVPELQQALIALGQSIEVRADALPGENFTASITAINPAIDVNGRSLLVHATLDNPDFKLKPGLLVRIAVKGPQRNAVTVPESAIVQRGDKAFVFTVEDNKAVEKNVQLGQRLPGMIEISSGLDAGADVVTAGNARLAKGAAVEVVPSRSVTE